MFQDSATLTLAYNKLRREITFDSATQINISSNSDAIVTSTTPINPSTRTRTDLNPTELRNTITTGSPGTNSSILPLGKTDAHNISENQLSNNEQT